MLSKKVQDPSDLKWDDIVFDPLEEIITLARQWNDKESEGGFHKVPQ